MTGHDGRRLAGDRETASGHVRNLRVVAPASDAEPADAGGVVATRYMRPWRVDVTRRPRVPLLVPVSALARLVAAALVAAGAPAPASLGVILADDAELADLNRRAMGHEGPTDVLSFPLLPPSAYPPHPGVVRKAAAPGREASVPAFALPPGSRPHLGDVVVSVERAVVQAREGRGGQTGDRRWSDADELRLLVVHGVLHVCGWDHAAIAERDAMRRLETAILGASAPGLEDARDAATDGTTAAGSRRGSRT